MYINREDQEWDEYWQSLQVRQLRPEIWIAIAAAYAKHALDLVVPSVREFVSGDALELVLKTSELCTQSVPNATDAAKLGSELRRVLTKADEEDYEAPGWFNAAGALSGVLYYAAKQDRSDLQACVGNARLAAVAAGASHEDELATFLELYHRFAEEGQRNL